MIVVSAISQKGGAGKSALVAHLAVAFESIGVSVVVIDLDPQESLSQWGLARGDSPPIVIAGLVERLPHMLPKVRESGVPLVLIDTPPHSDPNAVGAAHVSDLILVPFRPQGFDMRSLAATVQLLKLSGRLDRSWVVINHAPPLGALGDEAATVAKDYGIRVAPVRVMQRAPLGHAIIANKGITEYDPKSKAAAEIEALRDWIAAQVGLKIQ